MRNLRAFVLIFIVVFVLSAPATASEADKSAIQGTISQQIEAFRADDSSTAYSFAAPTIRQMFPTADIFMSMVKRGYQPVYRPQSFAFSDAEVSSGTAVQNVDIIGPKGAAWRAIYTLQKQASGEWKITGVQLVRSDDLGV